MNHQLVVPRHPAPATRADQRPALPPIWGSRVLFACLVIVLAIEYGALSALVPLLRVLRVSTLLAWTVTIIVLYQVGLNSLREYRQNRLFVVIVLWTGASVLWAVVRTYVPGNFRAMCDYFGLFLGVLYLVDRPGRIKVLSIAMSAVAIHLVVWNLDFLSSDVRYGAFRAAYFMGDGNDFAWGLLTLMVFPIYLVFAENGLAWRLFGLVTLAAGALGIVGTQSRGAFLAVLAALGFYWLFLSRHKARDLLLATLLLAAAFPALPSGYTNRMQTIENYSEDTSAQGRLRAWRSAIEMAVDYPLGVGAGNFNSAYGRFYRPEGLTGFAANRWVSAHSVYFKALGEYGFGGLIVLLTIIVGSLVDAVRCVRRIREAPDAHAISAAWPQALALGLAGYSVAGGFLGGMAYPHLFMLTGLVLATRRTLEAATVTEPKPAVRPEMAWQRAGIAVSTPANRRALGLPRTSARR